MEQPTHPTWKVCIDRPFLNCEHIFPVQQQKVRALIDEILKSETPVERILVFGSSVTERWHPDSDVDLYVETDAPYVRINTYLPFVYDLWTNNSADDRLKREILKTGVVVYEKGAPGQIEWVPTAEPIILYHGSNAAVEHPDLMHSRVDLDFGRGFYLTPDPEMAKKWAANKAVSVVSEYAVELDRISVKQLDANDAWLSFLRDNRRASTEAYASFDALLGPSEDDKMFNVLEQCIDGNLPQETVLRCVERIGLAQQYVFKTEKALRYTHFCKAIRLSAPEREYYRRVALAERQAADEFVKNVRKEEKG